MLDNLTNLFTLPYISTIAIITFIALLYAAYLLDQNKERGIIPTFAKTLLSWLEAAALHLLGVWYWLAGRDQDSAESIFDERTFEKILKWCIGISVFIAAVAFIGTYQASRRYAELHGLSDTAWGIPIAIDLVSILLALTVFSYTLAGKPTGKLKFLLVGYALLSVYLNVLHATETQALNFNMVLLGAVFPVSLFTAIELLAMLNKAKISRSALLRDEAAIKSDIAKHKIVLAELENQIDDAKHKLSEIQAKQKSEKQPPKVRKVSPKTGKEKVRKLLDDGLKPVEIIEKTGLASSTVYQYKNEFSRNGNGTH